MIVSLQSYGTITFIYYYRLCILTGNRESQITLMVKTVVDFI